MKTFKVIKNKIKPLIFLLMSIMFLCTSVYAWLTTNRTININAIEIRVEVGEGLQISLDGLDWKEEIESSEITSETLAETYRNHRNHVPDYMSPVSTALTTDNDGFLNMYAGEAVLDERPGPTFGEYILTAEKIVETRDTKSFVAFDIFLRLNYDAYLYLEEEAIVKDNAEENSGKKGRGIENAARVAFVYQGNISHASRMREDAMGIAAQGLRYTEANDGRNVTVWEPNYDAHTEMSKEETEELYGVPKDSPIWNSRILYDGIQAPISASDHVLLRQNTAAHFPHLFKSIPESRFVRTPKEGRDGPTNTGIILRSGVTKFRIYMWIEGQDYDCKTSASDSMVSFALTLSVERISGPSGAPQQR